MRLLLPFFALSFIGVACSGTTTTIPGGGGGGGGGGAGGGGDDGGSSNDAAADSSGFACEGGACEVGLKCCGSACVNETNDPKNCGACGNVCSGSTSMCLYGNCRAPTCNPACGDGYECCDIQGPGPSGPPRCVQGTTCPVGCPACAARVKASW